MGETTKRQYSAEELAEVDELSYDVLMCLRTGMPVNAINEYKLSCLLDGGDLSIIRLCPHLGELVEYFFDNGIDRAWNVGNMLVGC